jgi:hypothetical protein
MRRPILAALLVAAACLTGCSDFEIHEAICNEGEEPTWAVTNTTGLVCLRDGKPPQAGFARYPRGRVPVWINPPDDYAHRTEDGEDLYNVNPNDPDYPWWDEVLAEHPELACDGASELLTHVDMEPAGAGTPQVVVLLNGVGNRCFRLEWPAALGTVVGWDLAVHERRGPVWTASGSDGVSARRLLRVASDSCMRVSASIRLSGSDGDVVTFRLDQAKVPDTCNDY